MTGMLGDKVVIVTGASSGIGAAAARVFGREGAAVVLYARSHEPMARLCDELEADGVDACYVAGDVAEAGDVQRLVDTAIRRHGRVDAAFNNAGISQGGGALAEIDEAVFDRVVAVNLKGVWLSMRAELRAMLATGTAGAIVNTSSVGGLRGGAGLSAYSATKHGVIGLTRSAAGDYGPHGVRVNAIAPGTTDTPMIAAWKRRDPEIELRLNAATPLGRGGRPPEVAEAAAWLLSDRAAYVSGAVLVVDGGMVA